MTAFDKSGGRGGGAVAGVVIFDYKLRVAGTRPISWVKAARKVFDGFPREVRLDALRALTIAAEGRKADNAKPLTGLGSGMLEIVLSSRGDAWRVVYATQIGDDLWVVHAFQKKSRSGIKTPPARDRPRSGSRIKRLKEALS
jgi:phage-related protein